MDDFEHLTPCPRCGATRSAQSPDGLCAACLFAVAAERASTFTGETLGSPSSGTDVERASRQGIWPTPGHTFGPYRIERLLGRGGMGEVYEAEHVEQGRRVALKVLNQRLDSVEGRARFLREGELAASINHPHSVYIFGSEEISGIPAIAMELLPGGTLKDLVQDRGRLRPAEAVDAILQVIAGLDAMHIAGVLHRDVKPANCFVDRDGAVKIGDFGLSISAMARDVSQLTAIGTFQGTPQYAAPEQLKGDPLDGRADIYAVGATLYYLLTGRPPFDDTNLLTLVTRIATDAPRSPRALVPAVPRGLAAVVLRCLAKDRAMRPATYAALHDALKPFSSAAPRPARIGLRFIAGAIDHAILAVPLVLLNLSRIAESRSLSTAWRLSIVSLVVYFAYFGIAEGRWGASIGKRLMRMRVVPASGGQQPPGVMRAVWRAMLFNAPSLAFTIASLFLREGLLRWVSGSPLLAVVPTLAIWTVTALMFSTARRRNGFAGVHELLSGTRVVDRVEDPRRATLDDGIEPPVTLDAMRRRLGPFDVIGSLGQTDVGTLLVGFDPRLRRRVWLHELPPGAPAVTQLHRDLSRPGRLRWLGGRRTATDSWDAYEALDGKSFVAVLDRPRSWRVVRLWLVDLAREIDAGLRGGSLGRLALDFLWITGDGRAKLLDFRVPGAPLVSSPRSPASAESAQTFLSEVATSALTGHLPRTANEAGQRWRHALPVSASALLAALERNSVSNWSDVVRGVTALLDGPVRVEPGRRAATLALGVAMPLSLILMGVFANVMVLPAVTRALPPGIDELSNALFTVSTLPERGGAVDRSALETYVAGRFGTTLRNPQLWTDPFTAAYLGRHRQLIERIVADYPNVTPDQMAAATAALGPFLERQARRPTEIDLWRIALMTGTMLFGFTAVVGIVSAWLFRGGVLLRVFGIAVVTKNGESISRLRALWRGVVAWGFVTVPFWFAPSPIAFFGSRIAFVLGAGLAIAAVVVVVVGAVWAVVCPERGLQDRVARTYLVPQ